MLTTATTKRRPTPPGEMLLEEYLKPAGITQVALAAKPIQRVGTTPELWLNLQVAVDLWDAQQRMRRLTPAHAVGAVTGPGASRGGGSPERGRVLQEPPSRRWLGRRTGRLLARLQVSRMSPGRWERTGEERGSVGKRIAIRSARHDGRNDRKA
jgi:antitoxin HigA-1